MKDTTTTIDEILEDFNVWCLCDSRECQRSVNFKQAKQAILEWHKDKARSYVPEKVDPKDIWKKELGQPVSDAIIQADAYNEAIAQTLKAIGGEE